MKQPLALPGEGFHFGWVKAPLLILLAIAFAAPAAAQVDEPTPPLRILPGDPLLPPPTLPEDLLPDEDDERDNNLNDQGDGNETLEILPPPLAPGAEDEEAAAAPDYSRLSSRQERRARLDDMFARLKTAPDADAAKLVAEEIWSVWMQSGSESVDFTLRRATAAQAVGKTAKARALFDTVTRLQPDYAEGWARSGRLAVDEGDFSRAVGDSLRALQREPRHYYALWTLASVLERLGKPEAALDAYREANALYPELETVAERLKALDGELDGGVL